MAQHPGENPVFQRIGKRIETQEVSIDFGKQLCSSILLQAVQCSGNFCVWAVLVFVFLVANTYEIAS